MSVKAKPFSMLDVDGFEPLDGVFSFNDLSHVVTHSRHKLSEMYTLCDEQGVVGFVGASPLWPGRVDVWTVLSEGIRRHPKEFSVLVSDMLDTYAGKNKVRRMEAHVREGYDVGVRWIERFGFKREGLMKNYLPDGTSAYLYARCE